MVALIVADVANPHVLANMCEIIDDKSKYCVPFVVEQVRRHQQAYSVCGKFPPAFFVGLNGVQGAGKTTLVKILIQALAAPPHNFRAIEFSIDDLYLPHEEQVKLATLFPDNPLVPRRDQPSTLSVSQGIDLFTAISNQEERMEMPSFDKTLFNGAGDRRPRDQRQTMNLEGERPVEVVIFEGWCVGFRSLSNEEMTAKWKRANATYERQGLAYGGCLGRLSLADVMFVNEQLKKYDEMTNKLGSFIHIDAEDTKYVYNWCRQQEAALRAAEGIGMTDEQVEHFVDGYYPAYELYTEDLRRGLYYESGSQLRLVLGEDRRVREVYLI